jgi:hypothetical protein
MLFKRIFLFCLFAFSVIPVKAQLDLEHWFPPFFQSINNRAISQIKLYLSTDKTKPFKVNIYNNNTLIDTITLSNASPVEYTLADDSIIRSITEKRTMNVTTMGLYVAGEQSFYASLRFEDTYSEIIASKGKSALGKDFFVVNDQVLLYEDPKKPVVGIDGEMINIGVITYWNNEVASLKSDSDALNEFYRQFPRTESHAFRDESKQSLFNLTKIYQQIDYNEGLLKERFLTRGNFHWKDGTKDSEVVWSPENNGRFLVSWMPPAHLRNKKETNRLGKFLAMRIPSRSHI